MDELVLYIVKNLVSKPDLVQLESINEDGMLSLQLSVAPEDMGIIIGKAGQTIRAIRKLLISRVIVENRNLHVSLNLQES